MQRFFAGAGDRNGGLDRRKRSKLEKNTEKDIENAKRKRTFQSFDEDAATNNKATNKKHKNAVLNCSFVSSSSEDCASDTDGAAYYCFNSDNSIKTISDLSDS